MDKVISVEQFNYAVEMITVAPSEKAIFAYQNDPIVNRMVCSIKDTVRSNGVANNSFNLTPTTREANNASTMGNGFVP